MSHYSKIQSLSTCFGPTKYTLQVAQRLLDLWPGAAGIEPLRRPDPQDYNDPVLT